LQAAADALKQRHAEVRLQRVDLARGRGLTEMQPFRCPAKAPESAVTTKVRKARRFMGECSNCCMSFTLQNASDTTISARLPCRESSEPPITIGEAGSGRAAMARNAYIRGTKFADLPKWQRPAADAPFIQVLSPPGYASSRRRSRRAIAAAVSRSRVQRHPFICGRLEFPRRTIGIARLMIA
jgi:hypothetical protein